MLKNKTLSNKQKLGSCLQKSILYVLAHLKPLFVTMIALVFLFENPNTSFADTEWYPNMNPVAYHPDTGYEIYIDDWAELLTPSEEDALRKIMEPILDYGNVAFVTISENPTYSSDDYADNYFYDHFGYASGTVLLLDMEERYIWIHSNGEIHDTVTNAYADTITDNCYSYASDERYYDCAVEAFSQINALLEGRAIAQPMKYISNAFLAIVLALLINYFFVMFVSRGKKPSTSQLLDGIFSKAEVKNPRTEFINQTRRYSPQSTGTSRGSRSGGGSRGGGSRGGGGGHRF